MTDVTSVQQLVLDRQGSDDRAMVIDDRSWTYAELVDGAARRANLLADCRRPGAFHVGVLLDNGPEFSMMLAGAALAGATVVGINPTRRGAELERDIDHTECQILVTERRHAARLGDLHISATPFVVDGDQWPTTVGSCPAVVPGIEVDPLAPFLLLFTSGTTGDPKAAQCSQARLAMVGAILADRYDLTSADVCYQAMPMFHSNGLQAGWAPCLAAGATAAFRRRFSASGFLPDVRRYGVTYVNYVGKPLSYILATPEAPGDADNSLRVVFGNEAAVHDLERFSTRFGVRVDDAYGSTEGGVNIARTADTPPAALGRGDDNVRILDPDTGHECPTATFDRFGRLTNGDDAVGEIVSLAGAAGFEGYWNNPEADAERTREGIYWSGDLGYRDDDGFVYFAGRNFDWLRVDGENFAAAPVEAILMRHRDIDLAAVYAVPNATVGDDVMAAVVHRPDVEFDRLGFSAFLAAQADLGTKAEPRYLRWTERLPQTETNKILKRQLRAERWESDDEVWVRDGNVYRLLTADDVAAIRAQFVAREREAVLDG